MTTKKRLRSYVDKASVYTQLCNITQPHTKLFHGESSLLWFWPSPFLRRVLNILCQSGCVGGGGGGLQKPVGTNKLTLETHSVMKDAVFNETMIVSSNLIVEKSNQHTSDVLKCLMR